jgi:hypothetical protein
MRQTYKINIAGMERDLPLFPITDDLYIGAFIIFGDVEITKHSAKELLKLAPKYDIMMTADSNPEVMRCCYLAGFAESPYFMTYKEAADVTDTAKFNAAFNNSDIVNFDVGKYFTGINGTVGFVANKLKYFAFPPNCEISLSGGFPACQIYEIGMWDGQSLPNGSQCIHNQKVSNVIIDPNNHSWKLTYGHLGKGQFIRRSYRDNNTFKS